MDPQDVLDRVLRDDVLVPVIVGMTIVLCVLFRTIGGTIRSVSRERTRREIAAFISEGSLTPEQGERLMAAGKTADGKCC